MVNGDTQLPDDNLISWKLSSVEPSKLDIDLEFRYPLQVSQGDVPDRLLL